MDFELQALCYNAIIAELDGFNHYPEDCPVGLSTTVKREDNKMVMLPPVFTVREIPNREGILGYFPKSESKYKILVYVQEID